MKWRIIFFIVGLVVMGLGTSITVLSAFGTSFWNAISVGLQESFGLTVGTWFDLIQVIAAIINALVLSKKPDYLAVFTVILSGLSIDFWIEIVFKGVSFADSPLYIQGIIFVVGLIILGFSIGIYMVSNFSPLPVDKLAFAFHERFSWNLARVQTVIAIIVVCIAYLFHGPVGIGTIISVLSMGYIIKYSYSTMQNLLYKVSRKIVSQ